MPITKYNTTCPLDCFDCCSMVVSVDDRGEIVSIEGNKEHPITRGFICEKGRKHMERVHHASRIKYPMIKSKDEWLRISWEDALDLLADKIKLNMNEYGSKSIGLYSYSGSNGLLKNIEDLFFDYIGDTTQIYGSICCGAGATAQRLDFGKSLGHSPEDMENANTIVIWGRNPAETNIHLVPFLKEAKLRGASIILVDPLETATADLCDKYIRVKPEGDAALACAAVKFIIDNGLYDKEFAEKCTQGFAELTSYLEGITIEELSDISGVSSEDIALLAEKLATAKPAVVFIGYGLQRYPYGGTAVRCIDMLSALTGNIGISGGGVNYSNGASADYLDLNPYKIETKEPRMINRAGFGRLVKKLSDPPLKLLFISRANPVLQLPNTNEVLEAFESIEYKVVLDHFLTDTAEQSDMVLPVTYFLEEEDVAIPGMWSDCIGYVNKCVNRYYEAKPEYEIYTELSKRLGMNGFPEHSGMEWLELMLKPFVEKGLKLDELKQAGFIKNPVAAAIPWIDKSFATKSGKFELISVKDLKACLSDTGKDKNERYRLLTVHSRKSLHSQHMQEVEELYPTVYINPEDALEEGLESGEIIRLFNENGNIRAEVSLSNAGAPGVLHMNEGWWLRNGGSVNRLTSDKVSDIGNQGILNCCFCSIEKVEAI